MNEGVREDAVLWEVEPEGRWVFLGVPISRGSLTVMTFQIGIVIRNGEVVDVFSGGKRKLPRSGKVRAYVASTAPFNLTYWLMDPEDPSEPDEGVGLNQPVLTADKQLVTGRIDLTLRATRKNVEYLWQLLRPGSEVVRRRDISRAIEGELLAKVLALDIHKYTSEELRGNRELFRGMYESVKIELSSTIRRYGLLLDNFYPNWGLTHEERERIREQRHEVQLREIKRQQEIEDLANRERERRKEEELAEIERAREREREHEAQLREIKRQQEIEDLANRERERRKEEELAEIERARERQRQHDRTARHTRPPATPGPGVPPQRQTPSGGYWVYEDRPTSQARVHRGTCHYCNHGDGMGRGRIEKDNEWYGPFGSREDAFRRAEATGQRDVRGCRVCWP